ncbi:MAG: sigma-70 family RNA polymerase sigma factor [Bacteroidales bacterium]|nr:sigma-70 family RNA polymerase sigma factor [Bacteroidales bacterium]
MELEFAQTVREHKGTIYTVCYMFSNNPDEVADLFQEILINLWKGFPKFRGESNVRTWIYRISLNTCISSERKKSRMVETLPLTMDINLFSDSDDESKQIQMLRDRINKLGPFDRAIVLLWLENLSYDEIGAIVGISAKNVSVRLVRIKEQLKKMSNE